MTKPRAHANLAGEMPAEHALLGLLALAEGHRPAYGYDLARAFETGRPLGDVLRLEPGMLYHHLKKLERREWVRVAVEDQPGRPARRVYALTASGRAELDRWLQAPVARTREIRLEFLVKLYLMRRLAPHELPRLVAEQRAMLERILEQREHRGGDRESSGEASVDAENDDEPFRLLVRALRESQTRAAMDWLDLVSEGEETPEAPGASSSA